MQPTLPHEKTVATLRDYIDTMRETAHVWQWIWREITTPLTRNLVYKMLVFMVIEIAFAVSQAGLISFMVNGLIQHRLELVVASIATFITGLTIQKVAQYKKQVTREWLVGLNWCRLDHRLTELFFEKSMGQHLRESAMLAVSNIDKGRWTVLSLFSMLVHDGVQAITMLTLSIIALWIISPFAGLVVTLMLAFHLLYSLVLNKNVVQVCTPIDAEMRHLNRQRWERWDKVGRVRSCGKETEELHRLTDWFLAVFERDVAFWLKFLGNVTFRDSVVNLGQVTIMSYGLWQVWHGNMVLGTIYPLFSWATKVSENMWRISQIEHDLSWNMPSIRSMVAAVSLPPDIRVVENPTPLPQEAVGIAFRDITYYYQAGSQHHGAARSVGEIAVLKNLSFEVAPGEQVALVGGSGAGKTTILRLALRCMDPTHGQVLIGGHDLRQIDLTAWMHRVGYVDQKQQPFDLSVRDNMLYGLNPEERARVSDEELWRVMRLLKIDFGARLYDGLETRIGREGVELSGGQAQRLMVGAALMKRPDVLLIDEATSHLDSSTERQVQEGLAELLAERRTTMIVVAHRLSTVRHCDRFICLRSTDTLVNGDPQVEAIAQSFEELAELSPIFRELANDQDLRLHPMPGAATGM